MLESILTYLMHLRYVIASFYKQITYRYSLKEPPLRIACQGTSMEILHMMLSDKRLALDPYEAVGRIYN